MDIPLFFNSLDIFFKLDNISYNVLKRKITNTPLHETQTGIENHALRAKLSIISKQKTKEPVVTITKYCKHWLRYFPGCVFWEIHESKHGFVPLLKFEF